MERQPIDILACATEIMCGVSGGAFITTKAGDKVNTMAIEWGALGTVWGKRAFTCYIRSSRFTREVLDANPEFTVNIPTGAYDRNIMRVCGVMSGRDIDKVAACGFTLVDGAHVSVPAIAELPLTLECKVIYRQEQDVALIPADVSARFYPNHEHFGGTDRECHIMYIGEIVDAYVLE